MASASPIMVLTADLARRGAATTTYSKHEHFRRPFIHGAGAPSAPAPPPRPPPGPIPPAGAIIPTNRSRVLGFDATGNRIVVPYTRLEIRDVFNLAAHRDLVFGGLSFEDAQNLQKALRVRGEDGLPLRPQDFVKCRRIICEDQDVTLGPRNNDNSDCVANPPPFEPLGTVFAPCTQEARFTNTEVPGRPRVPDISYCHEMDPLAPALAAAPAKPFGHRRVCSICKRKRGFEVVWRQNELRYGLCDDCRTYATAQLDPQKHKCECAVSPKWQDKINNEDRRLEHLCRDHDLAMWTPVAARAQTEMDARRRMRLRRVKKPKNGKARNQMTPLGRRRQMRWDGPAIHAVPTCYCGNAMTAADHNRPNGHPPYIGQWRSCTGCSGGHGITVLRGSLRLISDDGEARVGLVDLVSSRMFVYHASTPAWVWVASRSVVPYRLTLSH